VAQTKTTEEFIRDAIKVYGNKYNYDQVKYKNAVSKVKIYCNKCKEYFYQKPNGHLLGKNGCKICNTENKALPKKEFINRAIKAHGNKYDYTQIKYINLTTKVKIYCNNCKEYFYQTPALHINTSGCSKCVNKSRSLSTEEFIIKAKEVHGDKYNYDQVKYYKSRTKVKIYCNSCNKYFYQTPDLHMRTFGCNDYEIKKRSLSTEEFIIKAKEIHGDKYNYDQVNYKSNITKVKIYCNNCKQYFYQTPSSHISGKKGCNNCSKSKKLTTKQFVKNAVKIYGSKYNYDQVEYKNNKIKVRIYCNDCEQYFDQKPNSHTQGHGCPYCVQKSQKELYEFINDIIIAEYNIRTIIPPKEIDIYIPEKNLAIEYNGVYYHSEAIKEKFYHYHKYLECASKSIALIQIYETEWHNRKEQVKSFIKTKLDINNIISYKQCDIILINKEQYKIFSMNNSIINYKPGNIIYGLLYNNEIVAVVNIINSKLINYIEKLGNTIKSGLYYILQHHSKPITYNDNLRYSIKEQLAPLTYVKPLNPDFVYFKNTSTYSKFYYPKSKFKKFDNKLTPHENMVNNKYYRIWDAGYDQYTYKACRGTN